MSEALHGVEANASTDGHTDGSTNGTNATPERAPYSIMEEPSRSGRPIKVITIGAGASALSLAHDVNMSPLKIELICYEKNPEIGGTWYENTYPGCACDIPAVVYQFSWAPSTHWTSYYSTSSDILQYMKIVAKNHDLMKYIRLSHKVVGAWWSEESQEWFVDIQRGNNPSDIIHDKCNILINAGGVLNNWKWPDIPGRESFKGPVLHSAVWDSSVDLKGKTVAVIGSGSSAVQIIPAIHPLVNHMKCFIRSQSWVTPGYGSEFAGKNGANFKYTPEQKKFLDDNPRNYLIYRKNIESELNSHSFQFMINGSKEQVEGRAYAESEMRRRLAPKPEIAEAIVPKDFAVGCRRPTPGEGYLETLCADNVDVVTNSEISEFTPNGIKTEDGVEHEVDVIVCATGFDATWKPPYPTIGREGRSLSEEWKDMPSTYLGVSVPHFPNYLVYLGPFAPVGHGSILPILEQESKYFMQLFEKMSHELVTSFEPLEEAVADFAEHRKLLLKRTAWASPCRSWFKHGTKDGEIMTWPGSRIQFFETIRSVRWEDYKLKTENENRFSYLGNGLAARELDGRDLTWYLGSLSPTLRGSEDDKQPQYSKEDINELLYCE